jgi:P22 coat protein - gene protein 5
LANSLITAQWVARKALVLLHAKSNFTGRTNRDYQSLLPGPINGVILGQQLSIRLPFQYQLRTGPQMNAQNSVQRFATLLVNQQLGVDINFTSVERAMLLNNFEEQVLEPAMARLAAGVENFTAGQVNNVPKFTGAVNTTATYDQLLQNEQYLTEALAPEDNRRTFTATPQTSRYFVKDNKGMFQPESNISDQWLEGVISDRAAGYTCFRNTKLPTHVCGTFTASSNPAVNGAGQSNAGAGNAFVATFSLVTNGWNAGADTLNAGDVITITGVNEVDPETKASLGRPKQFVVTATTTSGGGNMTIPIAPGIITGGAYQNVDSVPGGTATIQVFGISGAGANSPLLAISGQLIKQSLGWYRDAIVFANPPMLDLSPLVKMTAAEAFEGYNMRFAQQWDPSNDVLPARLDSIVGAVLSYPELAVRNIEVASAS